MKLLRKLLLLELARQPPVQPLPGGWLCVCVLSLMSIVITRSLSLRVCPVYYSIRLFMCSSHRLWVIRIEVNEMPQLKCY